MIVADCKEVKEFLPTLVAFAVKRLGYTVVGKQKEILESTKQIKVVRAARRTGKSFNVALITYALLCHSAAVDRSLKILFAGPRTEDTRHIWEQLYHMLTMCPKGMSEAAYEAEKRRLKEAFTNIPGLMITFSNYLSQSTNKKKMVFNNGTRITNATCEDPVMEDIRGDSYDFLAVDEYGSLDYKIEFMAAASQSLKDEGRLNLLMVIGTPDLGMGDEFDELFSRGQKDDSSIQSWRLTEDDCPFLDRESADVMNSLLDADGHLREVLGEGAVSGKLFPEFNYKTQVIPQKYNQLLPYFIGVDPGWTKPVVEFAQLEGANFRVFHEISCEKITVDLLINEIELAVEVICLGNQPIIVGCDKAGDSQNDKVPWTSFTLLQEAFPQTTYVTDGNLTRKVNQTNLYRKLTMHNRIWIDPSCKKLVKAFMNATAATKGRMIAPGWAKTDGDDDPLDAFMYGLINYNPGLIIAEKKTEELTESQQRQKLAAFFG